MVVHCMNGVAAMQSSMHGVSNDGGRWPAWLSFGSNDHVHLNRTAEQAVDLSLRSTG